MTGSARTALLIVTLDPPDPRSMKGGLYFNTIRQHVALGFELHVASLAPVDEGHRAAMTELGANLFVARSRARGGSFVRRLAGKITGEPAPEGRLFDADVHDEIGRTIAPAAVLGLQSYQTGMAARAIARALGVPYLCWEHLSGYRRGVSFAYGERTLRRLFAESDVLLGVSNSLISAIRERYGLALPQARIMPNPIPEGFATPPAGPDPDWLEAFAGERFLFGAWTSWRNRNKRLDLLLDAFALHQARRPGSALFIAGPHPDEQADAVRARGLEGAAVMGGVLSRADVHRLAHRIGACCVPSDNETFCLPMLEALAAGRPVVSTRCGGPDDILDDPRLGRLSPVGDVEAFAAAMTEVYDQRAGFDRDQIAGLAESRFGEAAQLARWRETYAELLGAGRVPEARGS